MSAIRIAISGLDTLQAAGLQQILRDALQRDFTLLAGADTTDADVFVVTPQALLRRLNSLSQLKERIVVLTADGVPDLLSVSPLATGREIADTIGSAIKATEHSSPIDRKLSARETEVLVCLARGLTAKEVADKLCISVNTVVTHRKNISAKLGIRSLSGLTLYAMMNGLLT